MVTSFTTPAKTLTFDARGRMAYVGCEGGDVLVYDARTAAKEGAVSRIAKAHPQRVRGLAVTSAKGDETVGDSGPSALVTAGSEGAVRAWDLRRASGPRDENPGTPVAETSALVLDTRAYARCQRRLYRTHQSQSCPRRSRAPTRRRRSRRTKAQRFRRPKRTTNPRRHRSDMI